MRHAGIGLPPRLSDFTDDHRLLALARRGEDAVGDLVLGRESIDRFLAAEIPEVDRGDYPRLALEAARGEVGSSVGGETPKFLAYAEGRHVIVKFAGGEGPAADRARDLLLCEQLALEAVRRAGLPAAEAAAFDECGVRFLEVARFDRIGSRGRRGVLSLAAIDAERIGSGGSWTELAERLLADEHMDAGAARSLRFLDAFGQLIGNTDRHGGNASFFSGLDGTGLVPCPAYDMLPMILAPSATVIVERPFRAAPATSANLDVWPEAARHAVLYWRELAACDRLGDGVRRYAESAAREVERAAARLDTSGGG